MEKRMKVYLTGPMQDLPDLNHPAFNSAAAKLRERGFYVYNPAETDTEGRSVVDAGLEDLTFLMKEADAIAVLPGWYDSMFARAEYYNACALGLKIFYLDDNGEIAGEAEHVI